MCRSSVVFMFQSNKSCFSLIWTTKKATEYKISVLSVQTPSVSVVHDEKTSGTQLRNTGSSSGVLLFWKQSSLAPVFPSEVCRLTWSQSGPSLSPLHTAEHPELSAAAAAAAAVHRDFNSQPGAQLTHKHTTEEESDFNRGEEFYNRWVKRFYTFCCTVKFSLGQMRCGSNEEDFHLIDLLNVLKS